MSSVHTGSTTGRFQYILDWFPGVNGILDRVVGHEVMVAELRKIIEQAAGRFDTGGEPDFKGLRLDLVDLKTRLADLRAALR